MPSSDIMSFFKGVDVCFRVFYSLNETPSEIKGSGFHVIYSASTVFARTRSAAKDMHCCYPPRIHGTVMDKDRPFYMHHIYMKRWNKKKQFCLAWNIQHP